MGMREDSGRAPKAWNPRGREHDPADPSPKRPRAGATSDWSDLERVPASTGQGSGGVRPLHLSVMMALLGGLAHFFTARSRGRGLSTKRRSPGTQDQPA